MTSPHSVDKPSIRFKKFTDIWKEQELGNIGSCYTASPLGYSDLSSSGKYKCVLYGELYTRYRERIFDVASRTNKEATLTQKNDILFPTSTTVDSLSLIAPSCVNEEDIRIGGDLFGIRPNEDIDGNFISYYINNFTPIKKALAKQAQGLTIVHIHYNSIKNQKLLLPSYKEQKILSELFIYIDQLITLHQQKQDKLQNVKKSMLEKMFPKNGSNIPEIRFAGFTDAWEQRKLGDIVDVCSGRDYKHLSEGDIPVYGTGGYMLSVSEALSYDKDAIGIGRKGTIDKPYILNAPFWTVDTLFYAIPREKIDLNFTFDIFQNIDWKKKDESTGVPSLSKTAINEIDVLVPQYDEQQALGEFFNGIDNLITLHQRKYECLVKIKKSLLNKMLV